MVDASQIFRADAPNGAAADACQACFDSAMASFTLQQASAGLSQAGVTDRGSASAYVSSGGSRDANQLGA